MARQDERIIQSRLGERAITLDKVLYFPRGIVGIEDQHEFTLLQIRDDSPFLILQSLDDPSVGLLVADPYSFTSDYEIKIGEAERKLLRLKNIHQVAVLVTVTIPAGQPEQTALNMTGPILVNHEAKIGLQVPQVESRMPSHFFLHQGENGEWK